MIRFLVRYLGFLLAVAATVEAFQATCFRLEGADELREIERLDVALGATFALAFGLVFAPSRIKAPWKWFFTITGAALIWAAVSGTLLYSHREQYGIRSAPMIPAREGQRRQPAVTNAEQTGHLIDQASARIACLQVVAAS